MPSSTINLALHSRHTISGASPSSGADATAWRARTAYEEMAAASRVRDDSEASFPVHEYDRARPTGDAYKAVWGYDKTARTQRSCCGAVCYTFLVPADAVDQVTNGACTLDAVGASVVGDRYLDQGAVLSCHVSTSDAPPAWADVLAATLASGPVCATSGQSATPNNRSGVTASVTLEPVTPTAPFRYLHLVLRLADYLGVRDTWIEGGAMLSTSSVTATFSRAVASEVLSEAPLDVGHGASYSGSAPSLSIVGGAPLNCFYVLYSSMSPPDHAAACRSMVALALSSPDFLSQQPVQACSYFYVRPSDSRFVGVCPKRLYACAFIRSGHTDGGTFNRVAFESPLMSRCPCRLVVFGIPGPISVSCAVGDNTLLSSVPLLSRWTLFDPKFLAGRASSVKSVASVTLDSNIDFRQTFEDDGESIDVPATTLAVLDVPGGRSIPSVDFRGPFATGAVATIGVALVPIGAPSPAPDDLQVACPLASFSMSAKLSIQNFRFHITASSSSPQYRNSQDSPITVGDTYGVTGHLELQGTYAYNNSVSSIAATPSVSGSCEIIQLHQGALPPGGTSQWGDISSESATFRLDIPAQTIDCVGSLLRTVKLNLPAMRIERKAWFCRVWQDDHAECNDDDALYSTTAPESSSITVFPDVSWASSLNPGLMTLQRTR